MLNYYLNFGKTQTSTTNTGTTTTNTNTGNNPGKLSVESLLLNICFLRWFTLSNKSSIEDHFRVVRI